jgi:hypothetical protein
VSVDGKRQQKTETLTEVTKTQAQAILAKRKATVLAGEFPSSPSMTIKIAACSRQRVIHRACLSACGYSTLIANAVTGFTALRGWKHRPCGRSVRSSSSTLSAHVLGTYSSGAPAGIIGSRATLSLNSLSIRPAWATTHVL